MCECVCERELIIAAPLVFSGGSSRISLRLSPGWDHRAGIVLACGEPAEMGECPSRSFFPPPLFILFHLLVDCFLNIYKYVYMCMALVCSYIQSIFIPDGPPSFPCVSPTHPVQPHLFPSITPSILLFFYLPPNASGHKPSYPVLMDIDKI